MWPSWCPARSRFVVIVIRRYPNVDLASFAAPIPKKDVVTSDTRVSDPSAFGTVTTAGSKAVPVVPRCEGDPDDPWDLVSASKDWFSKKLLLTSNLER